MGASHLETALLGQILEAGLPEPIPEFRFAPPRMWRFDYAWLAQKVACEVEGGVFSLGRHTRGKGFTEDCIKYNRAALHGWTVLRFTGAMINDGSALLAIREALRKEIE
jgi:very-short-patch-repair endonuclease